MLPWIEAIKNENGQHYCNQTFTVWSRLSLTNFGTPQNRSQWELGLQIIISCSYVTYEWCVQAILRYLPWSMKNYTCSGEDSGSAEQVFFSRAETDSVLELAPEYVLEYCLGLQRFRFRILLFSPRSGYQQLRRLQCWNWLQECSQLQTLCHTCFNYNHPKLLLFQF